MAEESTFLRSGINLHYKSNKELKNSESIKLKFQKETKKGLDSEVYCYQELLYTLQALFYCTLFEAVFAAKMFYCLVFLAFIVLYCVLINILLTSSYWSYCKLRILFFSPFNLVPTCFALRP